MRTFLLWLLMTGTASAACTTYDRSAWTDDQKQLTKAVAYELIFAAGQDIVPVQNGDEFCFPNSSVTLPTGAQILARYATDESARQANAQAEATRQAGFDTEITTNDLCTAELSDIVSRVETRRTTLRAAVESQRVTNNTTISSAANTVAGVKSAMTTVNNATAAEFGQTVDELASLATKIAKCVRGRAR